MLVIFIGEILSDFRRINGRDVYQNGATELASPLPASPRFVPFQEFLSIDLLLDSTRSQNYANLFTRCKIPRIVKDKMQTFQTFIA